MLLFCPNYHSLPIKMYSRMRMRMPQRVRAALCWAHFIRKPWEKPPCQLGISAILSCGGRFSGEFCRLFWGEALFCSVFCVHIADVAGNVFVVIGIGVAVFCGEIFSGISEEFVAGEKRPPCVFHRIRAIRGKKRLPLLCGEILIDEFIVFTDAEREAVCAADLPREHAKKFIAHHCKQVNGE